jgi:uncharacterized protein YhaN
VRIEHIRIDAFGGLAGLDTGPEPLEPLVVVLGPNEAGKSTLFSFLTTALYGFQPASRDRNPHVPWGSDEARGGIRIRLGEGGCAEVERRLRSAPSGTLTVQGRAREIRNQPVPWVEHVPRAVFRQVFAVTLAELAGLDGETWASIQDRVLGSMGAADLRPARSVAEALEKEAGEIWRPSRRGNQRLREVQDEVRELRTRRAAALERDRKIRAMAEEREDARARLHDMRAERERDRVAVEHTQELLPLKRRLDRVEALRGEGGPRDELTSLPADPRGRVSDLESELHRLRGRLASIDQELTGTEAVLARFDDEARTLLANRDRIARFVTQAAAVAPDRLQVSDLERVVVELELEVGTAADQLLSRACVGETTDAVAGVSIDLLRDRVARLGAVKEGDSGDHREPGMEAGASAVRRWLPSGGLSGAGLALIGWGVSGGPAAATTAGAALLAAGVTVGLVLLVSRKATGTPSSLHEREERSRETLESEISELLKGVPIRDEYLAPPGNALVTGLMRLQGLIRESRERSSTLGVASERVERSDTDAVELAAALGRSGAPEAQDLSLELEREVRNAERVQDAAESEGRERDRLSRERDTLAGELAAAESHLSTLRERLARLDAGADGLEVAERRMKAHARADQVEDELDRTYPDLAHLKSRIRASEDRGESWTADEEDLADRRARIEEMGTLIEELVANAEALDRDAAHLREMETVDAVDSEIESLRETERRLTTERDRKWILAQLVREADRRFREEHQPDLVRRASSYLEQVTGGRYDRLLVDETGDRDLFHLVGPGIPEPIPLAKPISTGTLEQAYLSLRLAIVDHLDQGNERLPLFIDEALVNWDDERRYRGLEVLASLSSTRQIFAFTCHPEMAGHLESRGARLLRLGLDA